MGLKVKRKSCCKEEAGAFWEETACCYDEDSATPADRNARLTKSVVSRH